MALPLTQTRNGLQFTAFIQPRASKNEIAGLQEDALKIRLTAPPVEGEANRACIKFLAKTLGLRPAGVSIVRGHSSRTKIIRVEGLGQAELLDKLKPFLEGARKK